MSQQPPQPPQQKRIHERPLSLYGMTFDQAVSKLVKAKPAKVKKKSRPGKPHQDG